MKSGKIIIITVTTSLLLGTLSPMVEAVENYKNNIELNDINFNDKQPKEVYSYEEFINAKEPVVIEPNLLTEPQLRQQGVSENDIREIQNNKSVTEYRAPQYGKVYGKKSWSKSISKNQITGRALTFAGALGILSHIVKHPVVTISKSAFTIIAGVSKYKKYNGVKYGGTAYKKLYRKNHYQTPKLHWLYHVNWAKRY